MTTRNEVHINSALQLLQARKEALDRMNRTSMRPHGKVFGMDVFTWFDYQLDDLVNTILSFPYPVHWIAKKNEVFVATNQSNDIIEKIDTVALYDSPCFELPNETADKIKNCISVDSMESAMIMMKAVEHFPSVLLITGSSEDWEQNKEYIEGYIDSFKK